MTTWYVSTTGGGDGTSSGSRWTGAQAAASTSVVAGDIITCAAGDYAPIVPANSGTSSGYITVKADAGAAVKFTSNLNIGSKSYLKYQGIELHSTGGSQCTMTTSSHHCWWDSITLDSTNNGLTESNFVGTDFSYVGFYVKGTHHKLTNFTMKKWYGGDAMRIEGGHHLFEDIDARYADCGHGIIMHRGYKSTFRRVKGRNSWSRFGQNAAHDATNANDCYDNFWVDCDIFDTGWDGSVQTYGMSAKTNANGWPGYDGPGDENLFKPMGTRTIFRNMTFIASNLWAGNAQAYAAVGQQGNYTESNFMRNIRYQHCLWLDNANEHSALSFTYNDNYTHYKGDTRLLNCIMHNGHTYSLYMQTTGAYLLTHYYTNNILTDPIRRGSTNYTAEQLNSNTGGFFPNASGNTSSAPTFVNDDYSAVHSDRSQWITRSNFTLADGSVGKGGGAPLATITASATNATTLEVSDAYAFYDGNGISGEVGDTIIIGTSTVTTVTGKPSATTITVSPAVSVTSGQNIWLQAYGISPDVGLVEDVPDSGSGGDDEIVVNTTPLANTVVTAGNPTSITSASFTPTANRLHFIDVYFLNSNATTAPTISSIGASNASLGTFTAIATSVREAGTDAFVASYWALASASPSSCTVTANFSGQSGQARIVVTEAAGCATTSPVVQTITGNNANASPSLTFASTPGATTLVRALLHSRSDADGVTLNAGFSEHYATTLDTSALQAQYRVGHTSTSVGWTGAGTTGNAFLAYEIAAAAIADSEAPTTTITSAPPLLSFSANATFTFTGTDNVTTPANLTFETNLDSAGWEAATSPKEYTGLSDGMHTFQVRATDEADNVDATPASYTWEVDAVPPDVTPPVTTITSSPPLISNSTSASFSFTGTDDFSAPSALEFEVQLDGGGWSSSTSPKSYTSLSEGSHTFEVRATDEENNTEETPATYTWTVDTTAPATSFASTPAATTPQTAATFVMTGSDAISAVGDLFFEIRLDEGDWVVAEGANHTFTGLSVGEHTVDARAVDEAGNVDATPASYTWEVTDTPDEAYMPSVSPIGVLKLILWRILFRRR